MTHLLESIPTETQRRIDDFLNMMMPNVTDCDYNKQLLYQTAKSRSGHLRLGKKRLPSGKDMTLVIGHEPKTEGGDDCVFSLLILSLHSSGSFELPPLYAVGGIPDNDDDATKLSCVSHRAPNWFVSPLKMNRQRSLSLLIWCQRQA